MISEHLSHLGTTIFDIVEWTRTSLNDVCVGLESWQIVAYSVGLTCVIVWLHSLLRSDQPLNKRIVNWIITWIRHLPWVKRKIQEELVNTRNSFMETIHKADPDRAFFKHLPPSGFSEDDILQEVETYSKMGNYNWQNGRVSGTVYGGSDAAAKFLSRVFEKFAWSNPLHPDVFPGTRKMEAEVVRMCCSMYNGSPSTCGTMTTGGTESILLACLAYRNRAYAMGIRDPDMVVPVTAHAAFDKAGELFRIQVHHVPLNAKTFEVDLQAMKRAITSNTCMLVGSAPGFPHGIIDPIEDIAQLGKRYGIPVHVDACLGGFLIPFMEDAGFPLRMFDFRLPGVTSISCDTHKYGFTTKGTSVVMYRTPDLLRYQFFCQPNWPGGIYASPTLGGSRCGSNIALCWATMLKYGRHGYVEATRKIVETARLIKERIRHIEGVRVIGDPQVSVIAFTSDVFSIYSFADRMSERGWNLNAMQFPSAVHIAITSLHTQKGVADQLLSDFKEAAAALLQNPGETAKHGKAAIYGLAQSIPDRSLVSEFAYTFLEACYDTDVTPLPAQNGVAKNLDRQVSTSLHAHCE